MSIELIAVVMFGTMLVLLMTGLPLTFVLGATGAGALILFRGIDALIVPVLTLWGLTNTFIFVAVPLFILMGVVLERSGVSENLFQVMYIWAGSVKGGLAIGIVIVCILFAAMCGTSGAATVSLGLIAIPPMLKREYDTTLVTGTIQAGGALGFLIPPSVMMIIYGMIGKVSVGRLYAAGLFPGLLLASLYIAYIGVRCLIQPKLGPAMPPEERQFTLIQKLAYTRLAVLPVLLIVTVLGSMFTGMASPTEASAVGVAGALILAAVHRRMSFTMLKEAMFRSTRIMGMVMWVALSAIVFSAAFDYFGGAKLIEKLFLSLQLGPWGILILIQLSFFVLGSFLEDTGILFITLPIYIPIVIAQGIDPIWFGTLFVMNMQMAYLTPPFGLNLFYMKGVVADLYNSGDIRKLISMAEIYRSIIPYVLLQAVGLALVMVFPQIALWLPNKLFGS